MTTKSEQRMGSGPSAEVNMAALLLLEALGDDTAFTVSRLKSDPAFRNQAADALVDKVYRSGPMPPRVARRIMGEGRFWGLEEWRSAFGPEAAATDVPDFPWGVDVLTGPCPFDPKKLLRETHFAFLGLDRLHDEPLTILKWQELHPASGPIRFDLYGPDAWFASYPLATSTTCTVRWYLMPVDTVLAYRRYEEQERALPEEYEITAAVAEVTKDILCARLTGSRPNTKKFSRCREHTGGSYVAVGKFGGKAGLRLESLRNDSSADVGAAASRVNG